MRLDLQAIAQAAEHDPKQAILDRIGNALQYEIFGRRVLVATYIEPETTTGGIIKPHRALLENRFQGKVGLVIRVGPMAFVDDSYHDFGGMAVEPGDWIWYRASDGMEMAIHDYASNRDGDGVACRVIEDTLIIGRVPDPSLIY